MRMNRCEFYIRKDFAFYDSCVAPVVGVHVVYLYEVLRRFIWRGSPQGELGERLLREGVVYASISQKDLGGATGTEVRQVRNNLKVLKDLGWVKVSRDRREDATCYELGQIVLDENGRKHEVLFADGWLQDLWLWLEERSEEEFGSVQKLSDDGDTVQHLSRRITKTTWEWRLAQVQAFTERQNCDHVVAETSPSSPGSEGPAVADYRNHRQQIAATTGNQTYLISREEKVENPEVEKREPVSLRSSASLGFRGSSFSHEGRAEREREESESSSLGWGRKAPRKDEVPRRVGSMSHLDAPSKFKKPGDGTPPQAALAPRRSFQKSQAASLRVEVPMAPESAVTAVAPPVEEDKEPEGWEVPVVPEEAAPVVPVPEVDERVSTLERIAQEAKRRGIESRTEAQLKERRLAQKKANLAGAPVPLTQKGMFADIEKMWLERMRDRFPGVTIAAWGGKERGQVKQLIEKYGGVVAKQALDYVVSRWDDIRARFLKGKGGVPSIGFLLRFHDTLVVEAQRRGEWLQVKEEWERWQLQHPSDPYPPVDLEARYQRCKRDVDGLGLPT